MLSCPTAAVPVPVSVPVEVDGWALLVVVSVALADPTAVGLKVIVKGTLCPAGIVTGSESLADCERRIVRARGRDCNA